MAERMENHSSSWHVMDAAAALKHLGSDAARGLDEAEAARRLAVHGPNMLQERGLKSPWRIFWEQLTASMVVILLAAAVISALLGDLKDAVAILIIVALNALLGFRQEYKAEQAMAALKRLAVPTVKVLRGGSLQERSAADLVPGDVIWLEEGNLAPADCRLLESVNLQMQEAALTGESAPVAKTSAALADANAPVADRSNMAYMGTVVTYGRGRGLVTETGMATELGRIAALLQTVEREPTPLQRRLNHLGRILALAALGLVGVVVGLGLLRGEELTILFLTAISLAVAAVPEGLPAVVTIALALGSQRMLKRRALIRKLPAVEALGSVTTICTDKTGTLTENKMTATLLEVAGRRVDLATVGTEHAAPGGHSPLADQPAAVALLLTAGALCNDASIRNDGDEQAPQALGDPTEAALVLAAARAGLWKTDLEQALSRVGELPFDSKRKRMTTVHRFSAAPSHQVSAPLRVENWPGGNEGTPYIAFTKGAVDGLLELSKDILVEGRIEPFTEQWRERMQAANDRIAQQGMRVLGAAYRYPETTELDTLRAEDLERDLVFLGMVGIIDPPRPEAKGAVATCKSAGIHPIMITGDHPLTARTIARELGIAGDGRVLTGHDLAGRSMPELENLVEETGVFARVSPEHKLHIVQALQNRGQIVAMTGDGVNDAPALKKADIGVAMGVAGTDVAKEVADIVLLDDNFATIVAAVEEGRIIYDNIRKFIKYLLTTNSGEIWVMLAAPFLDMPLPLLPLQILWINLVTDGLPALALGVEPAERDTMRRPPRRPNESVFSHGAGWHILWVGMIMGLIPLCIGFLYWQDDHAEWQTMVFTTLTFAQMAHVLAIRSERDSLFSIGMLSNRPMLAAVLFTSALQIAVLYVPLLQTTFRTVALSMPQMLTCIALSSLIFWAVEAEKWTRRRRKGATPSADHPNRNS